MKTFLIATKNAHKLSEISRMLLPLGFRVIGADELREPLPDVEETGSTFSENAMIKAESAFKASGMPVIADDSGLSVDALGGAPGVYSARYSGVHGDDAKNNEKLLYELRNIPDGLRSARYICAICCYFSEKDNFVVTGECEGKIAFAPRGNNGFGYDPLFISERGCFGVIPSREKDMISHRRRALDALAEKLTERGYGG